MQDSSNFSGLKEKGRENREGTYVGRREKKMRGKNSIEVGNRKSLLPLSSCYFCCIRKIFHSSSKNKSSTAAELMKPSVFYDLPSFTFFFPFFFWLNLPSAFSISLWHCLLVRKSTYCYRLGCMQEVCWVAKMWWLCVFSFKKQRDPSLL